MDYEKMWKKLKEQLHKDVEYHRRGVLQSMEEAILGEFKCKEVLAFMDRMEREEANTTI